jgi:2-succinyl-5-enolpyruvyl-6-hydroxy-3-cyclohexene-1-carboxylate synthase
VWSDGDVPDPATTQATFCATLVDEWVRAGVGHAVVAPGSRSTPMALALAARPELTVHVHHDERCAAFTALGIGLATGAAAVLLCTSGTAATHFHGAVVEAHQAGVPLVVVTADRPPELRDVGAPQAIDQTHLYGRAVRWFHEPGVADEAARGSWRTLGARSVAQATGWPGRPGPVHLNLAFREPLTGEPGPLPAARDDREPPHASPWASTWRGVSPWTAVRWCDLAGRRGVVVAGGRSHDAAALGARLRWPVIVGAQGKGDVDARVVSHGDALLRDPAVADALRPEAVLRVGPLPSSRVVNEWLARSAAVEHVIADDWLDPAGTVATFDLGRGVPPALADAPSPSPDGWADRWRRLDDAADVAIAAVLADHPEPTEPGTARTLLATLPAGAHLVVSSSMPVRDLEWYAEPRPDVTVHANRGANGIDGVLSTAVGVALATYAPTACLIGDVAFLHDSNALLGLARRAVDLTVVVVDNDGGGIFSFLPQASTVAPERFELLYGTPHGVRVEALAAAHGLQAVTVASAAALAPAIRASVQTGGARLVVVRTDRRANVVLHHELHAAVAAAARPLV